MIDSLPIEMKEKLDQLFDSKMMMIPLMLVAAAGTIAAFAGGYWLIYQLVTLVGAR